MFLNHYRNRRVLVTGHTGFKGFWLCTWLLELGAEVAGYSLNVPTNPSGFVALGLQNRITHITGDIRDRQAVASAVQAFRPEIIFHMAAQALVRPSYEDPVTTFETNAIGTMNVLEAVRQAPFVQSLVLITSDKCYRNDEWVFGYRETDHLGGKDPYSASKACAEIIAHAYFPSFFRQTDTRMATVRAGNVIGGGDWATGRIVPDCARAWMAGVPALIRSPAATRPWQHVLEPLSGYLWLGANLLEGENRYGMPLHGESFNFGPPSEVNATVGELAQALVRHWPGFLLSLDLPPDLSPDKKNDKKEASLLKLCCDKALAHLDWKAALPFADTVCLTAEWYLHLRRAADAMRAGTATPGGMYAFTASQIGEYTAKAREQSAAWTQ
jgi:CDP-glucose 4,6-dehydratase